MKRVKSVILNKFVIKEKEETSYQVLIDFFNSQSYSNKKGFGFNDVDFFDKTISTTLLNRTSTYVQDYDNQKNELIKRQIFLFTSIQISVDVQQEMMIVSGSLANINSVKSAFRNLFNFDYIIEPILLNVQTFIKNLERNNIKYIIQQITIKGFNYDNGMIGRFTGDITKQSTGLELINNFKSDIIKATFVVEINNEESLKMQLFPNGNIKFVSDEENYSFYLNFIKSLIID